MRCFQFVSWTRYNCCLVNASEGRPRTWRSAAYTLRVCACVRQRLIPRPSPSSRRLIKCVRDVVGLRISRAVRCGACVRGMPEPTIGSDLYYYDLTVTALCPSINEIPLIPDWDVAPLCLSSSLSYVLLLSSGITGLSNPCALAYCVRKCFGRTDRVLINQTALS